jgi:deoxycytidylate deaminase
MSWSTKVKRSKIGESVFNQLFDKIQDCEMVGCSKHAAAITYKGKVLSIGKCQMKTHPIMLDYQSDEHKIYLHAEIDAIVKTINNHGSDILKHCDIYVMRLTRGGNIGNSKPCKGCQKAIDAFGFKNVFWTE